jgi:hypothetical protein
MASSCQQTSTSNHSHLLTSKAVVAAPRSVPASDVPRQNSATIPTPRCRHAEAHLLRKEILATPGPDGVWMRRHLFPDRVNVVQGEEIAVTWGRTPRRFGKLVTQHAQTAYNPPVLNDAFTVSAACSCPNGVTKGDFAFNVAAMVSAGSRQPNRAA